MDTLQEIKAKDLAKIKPPFTVAFEPKKDERQHLFLGDSQLLTITDIVITDYEKSPHGIVKDRITFCNKDGETYSVNKNQKVMAMKTIFPE